MNREELLAEIRDAADDYRDADERLSDAETDARVAGLSEDEIREAKNLWLR